MNWNPQIEIVTEEVHRKYLADAYSFAWKHSEDPVTQAGAVIVNATLEEILAFGANHFPPGLNPTDEQKMDKKYKYAHIIHAEAAVINAARAAGKPTQGMVMYMPWVPCTDCANAIIGANIGMLVGHKSLIMKTPERWYESTDYALGLLKQQGVKLYMYDGEIGSVKNLFDSNVWEP